MKILPTELFTHTTIGRVMQISEMGQSRISPKSMVLEFGGDSGLE
jgi:hypothetical protein